MRCQHYWLKFCFCCPVLRRSSNTNPQMSHWIMSVQSQLKNGTVTQKVLFCNTYSEQLIISISFASSQVHLASSVLFLCVLHNAHSKAWRAMYLLVIELCKMPDWWKCWMQIMLIVELSTILNLEGIDKECLRRKRATCGYFCKKITRSDIFMTQKTFEFYVSQNFHAAAFAVWFQSLACLFDVKSSFHQWDVNSRFPIGNPS